MRGASAASGELGVHSSSCVCCPLRAEITERPAPARHTRSTLPPVRSRRSAADPSRSVLARIHVPPRRRRAPCAVERGAHGMPRPCRRRSPPRSSEPDGRRPRLSTNVAPAAWGALGGRLESLTTYRLPPSSPRGWPSSTSHGRFGFSLTLDHWPRDAGTDPAHAERAMSGLMNRAKSRRAPLLTLDTWPGRNTSSAPSEPRGDSRKRRCRRAADSTAIIRLLSSSPPGLGCSPIPPRVPRRRPSRPFRVHSSAVYLLVRPASRSRIRHILRAGWLPRVPTSLRSRPHSP